MSPIGRNPRRRNRAGFTLIELILLTIILSVIVAISTPLFRKSFASFRLRDSYYNLSKLINYAQEKAVLENTPYKMVIKAEVRAYYLMKFDVSEHNKYRRLNERAGRIFHLPADITVTSSVEEIVFYPDGHSDKAIINFAQGNRAVTMTVVGRLGYVQISAGS